MIRIEYSRVRNTVTCVYQLLSLFTAALLLMTMIVNKISFVTTTFSSFFLWLLHSIAYSNCDYYIQ